jgi:hypothetical protein
MVVKIGLLHLREEHKLKMFENRVLRRMRWARMGEGYTGFLWESPKERDHLKNRGTGGRKGLEGRLARGGVEWIHVAQDMDQWLAVMNAVMNFQVLA